MYTSIHVHAFTTHLSIHAFTTLQCQRQNLHSKIIEIAFKTGHEFCYLQLFNERADASVTVMAKVTPKIKASH